MLQWRNRPEVRKNMYTTHIISKDEHYKWYQKIKKDPTKIYFICMQNEDPAGVVYFTEINQSNRNAFWAFYSGNVGRKGIGSQMEFLALNYAFENLDLNKLNCEVLAFNEPVIALHRKFGFKVEGVFKQHHLTESGYVDVFRLAIFKSDWQKYLKAEAYSRLFQNESSYKPKIKVGSSIIQEFKFTRKQIQQFAEATGDDNPIHLDEKAAQAEGLPGTICHGFLIGSIFSKILGTKFPGNGTIYVKQNMEFRNYVEPNEKLKAKVKILSKIGNKLFLETKITNEKDDTVIEGEAEVINKRL
jgi:UDP-4-amino-4,6-dideoxy-N-acetyl-beta-L-altrosamine N-acetyltransferase